MSEESEEGLMIWVRLLGNESRGVKMLEIPEIKATRLLRHEGQIYCFATIDFSRGLVLEYRQEAEMSDV